MSANLPVEISSPAHIHKTIDNIAHVKALADVTDEHHACLIDVRGTSERDKDGKIPHAQNIPIDELPAALEMSPEDFKAKYGFKKPNKDTPIVTHCWAGMRANKAQDILLAAGFTHVKSFPGSYKEWYEKEVAPKEEKKAE